MNSVLARNINDFVRSFELSSRLAQSTFLITGSTGLIGSALVHSLIALNRDIHIVAPVRNLNKAYGLFDKAEVEFISFIECDLCEYDYNDIAGVDYIVHCAAPTSSRYFIEHPVETFDSIYQPTRLLLNYARYSGVKCFVYLSSLEVYGAINDDGVSVTENIQGYVDPMSVRSCYPMAKRASENLCQLYASEYGVDVRIARLTQVTGAGFFDSDTRVIVQFCRAIAYGDDIVLHTLGDSAKPYCYTMDCVSAILYIILNGTAGEAYNVANEDTYISVRDLALFSQKEFNNNVEVKFDIKENMGYAPETKLRLSTEKLCLLGWSPQYSLYDILNNLVMSFTWQRGNQGRIL